MCTGEASYYRDYKRLELFTKLATSYITEKEDDERGIHEQDIFDGVVLFLAAITLGLFRRVLGADNPPLGAVMGKSGDAGAVARGTGSSSRGGMTDAASASETPSRWARAVRERAGASPRVWSAARSAGRSM
jgi:hypothetical protein